MQKKPTKGGGSNTLIKSNLKCLEESIIDIINDISKKQYSADFREPVDVQSLGLNDYYEIVKKPMDLSTLKNKFLEGEYKTIQDVWDDFDLIVNNCKAYNRVLDHPIRTKADQMKIRVDKSFQKLIEDYKAQGFDTDNYIIQVDQTELKAKEEKKKKIKLDGLDSKNILIGGDKRLYIPPGSLNEKNLFNLQNQDIQLMQQQARNPSIPITQLVQFEDFFQANQLKSSLSQNTNLNQSLQLGLYTPSNTSELPNFSDLKHETSIRIEKQKPQNSQGNNKSKSEDTTKYQAKIQELQMKQVQINEEIELLKQKKEELDQQKLATRAAYTQSIKQKKQILKLCQSFQNEVNNIENPNGSDSTNNLTSQSNLNGSSSKNNFDMNDGNSEKLRTPQKKDFGDEKKSRKMEIENDEGDKDVYYEDDDDDDIVIKKKVNNQDDSAQKQQDKNGEGELSHNSSSTQSLPLKNKLNTSGQTSKTSQKQSLEQQKSNIDSSMYQTPTKQQLHSSNLSSEKVKQNSDSKLLSTMKDFENRDSDEDEFKPTSLNTVKQQPTSTQQGSNQKIHGLKPTSSTTSSASLKHKNHLQQSGNIEKASMKKPLSQSDQVNQKVNREMVTPEKKQNSTNLGKKDVTPSKFGSKIGLGMTHTHQTHGKLNQLSGNIYPSKINKNLQSSQTNGSQNILSSQSNLSPMQKELKAKKMGDQTTPQKSSLQNQQKQSNKQTTNGSTQHKKIPSEGLKITIGGEQISKVLQDGNQQVKKEEGLKIKIKDSSLQNKEGEEQKKISKISIPNPAITAGNSSLSQLPAPELKQNQSIKAAQILQMGQDKKNREIEKTEEQKKLEEKKKRENILKKEMKLFQQKQAEAAAANAAGTFEGGASSDSQKIILMKNPSIKGEDGSNCLKITLDPQKLISAAPGSGQDINFNSRQIYDKIIPSGGKKSKKSSINQDPNSTVLNTSNPNINYSKIKINVGGSPVVPSASVGGGPQGNIQSNLNFSMPQISVGGERVDFKFTIDKKQLRKEYENMVRRKQQKYRKLLEVNLNKMQKVTNWMIKEWAKQKKDVRSETLDYFKDILNDRQKIKDNLDVRKIQLFLKMFLYRLRDFYGDLKQDYIEKLKSISEKMYRIGSRAIVYKSPLQHRDNIKNSSFDQQVSNTQILDESHPLKKLQEEILEIEREMKLFRRMLSRDILKYQEQTDATVSKINKKSKTKDDQNSQYGSSEQGQLGNNAGQGYDDQKDAVYGDRDQQQKQSEIFSYFLEYNKFFEKQTSDLQRIKNFLDAPQQTNLLNHLVHKYPVKAEQSFDICETYVDDDKSNQVEILDYIKKKRKLNSSMDTSSNKSEGTKIEEESENLKINQDLKFDDKQLEQFSFSLNFNNNFQKEEGDQINKIGKQQILNTHSTPKNVFSIFDDEEDSHFSVEEDLKYKQYQKQKLKNSKSSLRICNSGSEFNQQQSSRFQNSQIIPDIDVQGIIRVSQLLNSQIINKKIIFDLYKDRIKRRKITEIRFLKINKIGVLQKRGAFDSFNQQFFMKVLKNQIHYLDENTANTLGLNGIIDISAQFEIRLEKEFIDQNCYQYELNELKSNSNHQKQNQGLGFEFSIKNCINNITHAYFSETEQIVKQLQLNCKENANIYSFICPEDIESVVESFKVENCLQKFLQHNQSSEQEFSSKEQYDPQSALNIRLIRHQKVTRQTPERNPQNQKQIENLEGSGQTQLYQIDLAILTPINSLRDLEIRFNNKEFFKPTTLLQQFSNQMQQQIQQQQVKQANRI